MSGTNYWGLKKVINSMRNIFTPGARVVNTSSHLGHLSLINGEAKKSLHLREQLADPNIPEKSLDTLMTQFMNLAKQGGWEAEGWPNCAYTASKVGVNVYTRSVFISIKLCVFLLIIQTRFESAYTVLMYFVLTINVVRILQRQFDEEGNGVVVNSIHPGTKHSKIQQQSVIPLEVNCF